MTLNAETIKLRHKVLGPCELVQVAGLTWVLRLPGASQEVHIPVTRRTEFTPISEAEFHQLAAQRLQREAKQSERPDVAPNHRMAGGDNLRDRRYAAADGTSDLPGSRFTHQTLGVLVLERVESTTGWFMRSLRSGKLFMFPPSVRSQLRPEGDVHSGDQPPPAALDADRTSLSGDEARKDILDVAVSLDPYPQNLGSAAGPSVDDRSEPASPSVARLPEREASDPDADDADETLDAVDPRAEVVEAADIGLDRKAAFALIESLRIGLPPQVALQRLAMGLQDVRREVDRFLMGVEAGGSAMLVKGVYGQGKTFSLQLIEEHALRAKFVVARTEIDATENRLNKPHHIYQDLLQHLRVPGFESTPRGSGAAVLSRLTAEELERRVGQMQPYETAWRHWEVLTKELACPPLAWLLSDPTIADSRELQSVLAGKPIIPLAAARIMHSIRGHARTWPAFTAGTQGDFGSFVLSGLGRLSRMIGFRGMLIILDEMEKWQELNWKEQSQAGNLLGGLIWGATETKRRRRDDHRDSMEHSLRVGGFPFTTEPRNHLGVVIAMTPRGNEGPELLWSSYGTITTVDLPELNGNWIRQYCQQLLPIYRLAYAMSAPDVSTLEGIARHARNLWRQQPSLNTRSAVQAAVQAMDEWRDTLTP